MLCSRTRSPGIRPAALIDTTLRLGGVTLLGVLSGCATPGPLHVYLLEDGGQRNIVDFAAGHAIERPSFPQPGEKISGFAYDPFTDHFFLRLEPGNRIRVVDRPARAIKREFEIAGLNSSGGGDLAVRPRDGHIFLIHENGRAIAETSRLGKLIRVFQLAGLTQPAGAIAIDPTTDRLFVLLADGSRVTSHAMDGRKLGEFTLEQTAALSLAFDPEKGHLYAPLANGMAGCAIFTLDGRLHTTLPLPLPTAAIDVGPRSFIRVF